ncbi:hypothetical protein quinque_002846 [Culex quinquefasciatus]
MEQFDFNIFRQVAPKDAPLRNAISLESAILARNAIVQGANINCQYLDDWNTPPDGYEAGGCQPIVELLISHNPDLGLVNGANLTAAEMAQEAGEVSWVRTMIEAEFKGCDPVDVLYELLKRRSLKVLELAIEMLNLSKNNLARSLAKAWNKVEVMNVKVESELELFVHLTLLRIDYEEFGGAKISVKKMTDEEVEQRMQLVLREINQLETQHGLNRSLKLLLEQSIFDVDVGDFDQTTPLQEAACRGHKSCVELLLTAGADVEYVDLQGTNTLTRAFCGSQEQMVQLLLERQVSLDNAREFRVPNSKEESLLHLVASGNNPNLIDILVEIVGIAVDVLDSQGCTALHYAAEAGAVEAVERLLTNGATATDQRTVIELLIGAGSTVDAADMHGSTPLLRAVSKGHMECFELLRRHGANVELLKRFRNSNYDNESMLHITAEKGLLEMTEMLVEEYHLGVDYQDKDGLQFFPHFTCSDRIFLPFPHRTPADPDPEVAFYNLRSAPLDASLLDIRLFTRNSNPTIFRLDVVGAVLDGAFLEAGEQCPRIEPAFLFQAVTTERDSFGVHPVGCPCETQSRLESVILARNAIVQGANINCQYPDDWNTPLQMAIAGGCQPIVELLISHNPDLGLVNGANLTAAEMAQEAGEVSWVRTMIEAEFKGCDPVDVLYELLKRRSLKVLELAIEMLNLSKNKLARSLAKAWNKLEVMNVRVESELELFVHLTLLRIDYEEFGGAKISVKEDDG